MTVLTFVALVVGLVCLVAGAELLVRGAASIASRFGIAPVIIGLTVVAFGTSAPELAVSVSAGFAGDGEVAFGNVAGSNIANILLILGASAIVGGLVVSQRIIRLDIPLLIVASVVTLLLSLDNEIGRVDGVILFAGIVAYTTWLIRVARNEGPEVLDEYDDAVEELEVDVVDKPLPVQVALLAVGLGVLVLGSQLLVGSATDIAEELGVSDLVIGLTVVAIGTSLPELATSLMAAVRGQRDIAVGNVVGSNLFNLLSVLGLTSIVSPDPIPVADSSLRVDFPVVLAATIVLVPIVWKGFRIERWEGFVLVAFYALYVMFLVLDANDNGAVDVVGPAALVVAPLVFLGFSVAGVQGWRQHRREQVGSTS
jgi:cation:H+ antiporter